MEIPEAIQGLALSGDGVAAVAQILELIDPIIFGKISTILQLTLTRSEEALIREFLGYWLWQLE